MHSFAYRANALATFALTILAVICGIASLSDNFNVPNPTFDVKILNINWFQKQPHGNDEVSLTLNISADLQSMFTWNTKQVFVFVAAEYATPQNALNQVSLWDGIIPSKVHAKFQIHTTNKYRLIDQPPLDILEKTLAASCSTQPPIFPASPTSTEAPIPTEHPNHLQYTKPHIPDLHPTISQHPSFNPNFSDHPSPTSPTLLPPDPKLHHLCIQPQHLQHKPHLRCIFPTSSKLNRYPHTSSQYLCRPSAPTQDLNQHSSTTPSHHQRTRSDLYLQRYHSVKDKSIYIYIHIYWIEGFICKIFRNRD